MDKTNLAVNVFNQCANQYQERFMDLSMYHETFDAFCNSIKIPHASILELACGPGNITKYLVKKRPDFTILATDLAPNMLELAKANNPNVNFKLLDCKAFNSLNQTFDAIICGFGLPYLSKEEAIQMIADAAKQLHPNGVLYISTMEDDYSKSGLQTSSDGKHTLFMHFHQTDYLAEAIINNGFELIELKRISYHEPKPTNDLVLIAKKIT